MRILSHTIATSNFKVTVHDRSEWQHIINWAFMFITNLIFLLSYQYLYLCSDLHFNVVGHRFNGYSYLRLISWCQVSHALHDTLSGRTSSRPV